MNEAATRPGLANALGRRLKTAEACITLDSYLHGALTLDELIDWAERLHSSRPEDEWLARVSADLSNPLLCREQTLALVHGHLRSRTPPSAAARRLPPGRSS